ncbi:MAG TPA: S24/S26 family peptidase [Vicinamibacteria bacterium]
MSELRTAPPVFADQVLRDCFLAFPEVVFAVTGECMSPDLREGERVRLVSPALRAPRLGDVVLTRTGGDLRLHRLVWGPPFARRAGLRTKADRAPSFDPALGEGDILGTVVAVEGRPYERRLAGALVSLVRATVRSLRLAR